MNFPSQIFFNNIHRSYTGALLKKSSSWLLLFYMAVATYFHYEKVHRTMRTAIVSYLLNRNLFTSNLTSNSRLSDILQDVRVPKDNRKVHTVRFLMLHPHQ